MGSASFAASFCFACEASSIAPPPRSDKANVCLNEWDWSLVGVKRNGWHCTDEDPATTDLAITTNKSTLSLLIHLSPHIQLFFCAKKKNNLWSKM